MATRGAARFDVPLAELHDSESGRIDAARVAEFLSITLASVSRAIASSYPSVHKTPDAPSLQDGLGPIKRTLELVSRVTRNRREALAWLNNPHPDLDGKTPLNLILNGRADAVVALLENALAGIPS